MEVRKTEFKTRSWEVTDPTSKLKVRVETEPEQTISINNPNAQGGDIKMTFEQYGIASQMVTNILQGMQQEHPVTESKVKQRRWPWHK